MLINNAGVVQGKAILDLTPEDVQQYVPSGVMYFPTIHPDIFLGHSRLTPLLTSGL